MKLNIFIYQMQKMSGNTSHQVFSDVAEQDCAVCLQKCHHPTQLPCGHIFCFLCVKGVAIQSKKCAMCRAAIPPDYLDNPIFLENLSNIGDLNANNSSIEYQWYYEGRNGWWKYDEQSNEELENSFNSGENTCTLLLAGALYIIDFQNMVQLRRNDHTRRRKVKRDIPSLPAKGVAGIKTEIRFVEEAKSENISSVENSEQAENEVVEIINDESNNEDEIESLSIPADVIDVIDRISIISIHNTDTSDQT